MDKLSYEQVFDILRREKSREDLQEIDKNFYTDLFAIIKEQEAWIRSKQVQQALATDPEFDKKRIELKNFNRIISELIDRRMKKIMLLALSRTRIASTIINIDSFSKEEEFFFENCVKLLRSFRANLSGTSSYSEDKTPNLISFEFQEKMQNSKLKLSEFSEPKDINSDKTVDSVAEKTSEAQFKAQDSLKKDVESRKETSSETQKITEKEDETIKVRFLADMPRFYGLAKEVLGPYEKGQITELPLIIANILIKKSRAELLQKE